MNQNKEKESERQNKIIENLNNKIQQLNKEIENQNYESKRVICSKINNEKEISSQIEIIN